MTSQTVASPPTAGSPPGSDLPAPFSLDISSILSLLPNDAALDEWFLRFASDNDESGYQFEIDQHGRLWAMASEGLDGQQRQFNLQFDLQNWLSTGPGGAVVIGNALVRLPGFGRKAADAGWISPEQLEDLPPAGQRPFGIPFAPRFVVETRSQSDSLESQQSKMEEWKSYGVAVGWLIDPFARQVHVYRPDAEPEVLDDPETIDGGPELVGFVFDVRRRVFDL
ncbi:MAG: Uma2 family endonuclease [Chloroflexi bacterium]|nr:Uma2 family endonuclease [Chloroflexota bacterium]